MAVVLRETPDQKKTPPLAEIKAKLPAFSRRLQLRRLPVLLCTGLTAGLGTTLVVLLISRFIPLPWARESVLFLPTLGLVSGLIAALVWRIEPRQTARLVDRAMKLDDRLATALELGITFPDLEDAPPLVTTQIKDAAQHFEGVHPKDAFPVVTPRRELLFVLGGTALLALLYFLPNPQDSILQQQREIHQAIANETSKIKMLPQELQKTPTTTAPAKQTEQQQKATQILRDLQRELQTPKLTKEQALAKIEAAQQKLEALKDPTAQANEDALQSLGQALSASPQTKTAGDNLQAGKVQDAANDIRKLAGNLPNLTTGQKQDLARTLTDAASKVVKSDPQLASQLQQAANALRSNDLEKAASALQQVSNQIAQNGQQAQSNRSVQQAINKLQDSKERIAGAGQQQNSSGSQTQNGQPGQNSQGQQAPGQPGQGQQSQGQAPGQPGQQGQGQGQQSQGQGQGQGSPQQGGTGTGSGERIYNPGGAKGKQNTVTGSQTANGQQQTQNSTQNGEAANSQAETPYTSAYAQYAQEASDTLNSSYIPLPYKHIVRDYFTSLDPASGGDN